MTDARTITVPASRTFTVRSPTMVEPNMTEADAWATFMRWCHSSQNGTRVELLRNARVVVTMVVRSRDLAHVA